MGSTSVNLLGGLSETRVEPNSQEFDITVENVSLLYLIHVKIETVCSDAS